MANSQPPLLVTMEESMDEGGCERASSAEGGAAGCARGPDSTRAVVGFRSNWYLSKCSMDRIQPAFPPLTTTASLISS